VACGKQISTENGIRSCDLPTGHTEMHHAKHPGGQIVDPYRRKVDGHSPFHDSEGHALLAVDVAPLEMEWPQEGQNEAVRRNEEVRARPKSSAQSRGADNSSPTE